MPQKKFLSPRARACYEAALQQYYAQQAVNVPCTTDIEKERQRVGSRVENADLRAKIAGVNLTIPSEVPKFLGPIVGGLDALRADIAGRAYERTYKTRAGQDIGRAVGPVLAPILAGNPLAGIYMSPFMTEREIQNIDKAGACNVSKGMQLKDTIETSEFLTKMGWARPKSWGEDPLQRAARGIVSFAGDYATDPLSWLSFGTAGAAKKVSSELIEGAAKAGIRKTIGQVIDESVEGVTRKATKEMLIRQGMSAIDADDVLSKSYMALGKAQQDAVQRAAVTAHPGFSRLGTQVPFAPTIERAGRLGKGASLREVMAPTHAADWMRKEIPGGRELALGVNILGEKSGANYIPRALTTAGKNARAVGAISGGIITEATRTKSATDRLIMAQEAARIIQKQQKLGANGQQLPAKELARLDKLNRELGLAAAGAQVMPSRNMANFQHVADIKNETQHACILLSCAQKGWASLSRTGDAPTACAWVVSPSKYTESVLCTMPTVQQVAAYTKKYKNMLRRPGHFVGLYQNDEGKWVLDINVAIPKANADEDTIKAFGREWGQDEIVDLDTGNMVKTGYERALDARSKKDWRKLWRQHQEQAVQLLAGQKIEPTINTPPPGQLNFRLTEGVQDMGEQAPGVQEMPPVRGTICTTPIRMASAMPCVASPSWTHGYRRHVDLRGRATSLSESSRNPEVTIVAPDSAHSALLVSGDTIYSLSPQQFDEITAARISREAQYLPTVHAATVNESDAIHRRYWEIRNPDTLPEDYVPPASDVTPIEPEIPREPIINDDALNRSSRMNRPDLSAGTDSDEWVITNQDLDDIRTNGLDPDRAQAIGTSREHDYWYSSSSGTPTPDITDNLPEGYRVYRVAGVGYETGAPFTSTINNAGRVRPEQVQFFDDATGEWYSAVEGEGALGRFIDQEPANHIACYVDSVFTRWLDSGDDAVIDEATGPEGALHGIFRASGENIGCMFNNIEAIQNGCLKRLLLEQPDMQEAARNLRIWYSYTDDPDQIQELVERAFEDYEYLGDGVYYLPNSDADDLHIIAPITNGQIRMSVNNSERDIHIDWMGMGQTEARNTSRGHATSSRAGRSVYSMMGRAVHRLAWDFPDYRITNNPMNNSVARLYRRLGFVDAFEGGTLMQYNMPGSPATKWGGVMSPTTAERLGLGLESPLVRQNPEDILEGAVYRGRAMHAGAMPKEQVLELSTVQPPVADATNMVRAAEAGELGVPAAQQAEIDARREISGLSGAIACYSDRQNARIAFDEADRQRQALRRDAWQRRAVPGGTGGATFPQPPPEFVSHHEEPRFGEDILGNPREMPEGSRQPIGAMCTVRIGNAPTTQADGTVVQGVPAKFKPMPGRDFKKLIDSIPTVVTSEGRIDLDIWERNVRRYMQQFPELDRSVRQTIGERNLRRYLTEMRDIMYENFGCALNIEAEVGAKSVEGSKKYGQAYLPGRLPQQQTAEVQRALQELFTGQKTNDEILADLENLYRSSLTGDFDVLQTGRTTAERAKTYETMAQRLAAGELTETNPIVLAERRVAEAKKLANREKFLTTMAEASGVELHKGANGKWLDSRGHEVAVGYIVENHDASKAWKMRNAEAANRIRDLYMTGGLHPPDKGLMKFFGSLASPLLTLMTVGRIGFTVTNTLGNLDFIVRNGAAGPQEIMEAVSIYNQLRKFGGDTARFGRQTMQVGGRNVLVKDFLDEALTNGAITPPHIFLEAVTDPNYQNVLYRAPGIKHFLAANQSVNNVSENGSRLAVYMNARGRANAPAARDIVDKVMLDYELSDLLPTEQEMRKFIPFYTWSRRNIPATAQLAVQRPGVFGAEVRLPRTIQENQKPEGCTSSYWDTYKQMPEFQRQQGMPFVAGLPGALGMSAVNLRLPMADPMGMAYGMAPAFRGNPQGAISDVVGGLLGPTIKTGAELLTGARMGTGQPLSRYADAGTTWGDIGQFLVQSTPVVGPFYNAAKNTPGLDVSLPGGIQVTGKCVAKGGDPNAFMRTFMSNLGLYNKAWNPCANQLNWNYADAAAMEAQLKRAQAGGTPVPTTRCAERITSAVSTIQGPNGNVGEVQADGYTKWYSPDGKFVGETSPGGRTSESVQKKLLGYEVKPVNGQQITVPFGAPGVYALRMTDGSLKWYMGERYLGSSDFGAEPSPSLMAKIQGRY